MIVGKTGCGLVLLLVAVSFQLERVECLEMELNQENITNKLVFFKLNQVYAEEQPSELNQYEVSFTGKMVKRSDLTLDERCDAGLPLSLRWTNYGPYANLVRGTNVEPKDGLGLAGIFPSAIRRVLEECCHRNTTIEFGQYIDSIKNLENGLSVKQPDDIMFPIGLQDMAMTVFKDLSVVPLLTAPRTTLFIPDTNEDGKTEELFKTVGGASPILAFIFLSAVLSGVFIWVFDHIENPEEFSTAFIPGVWEGFWWAVVTMTTVGYGDRAPRSILGRLFSIVWIVIGMSIIAIFTAMITASLSASIQDRFVLHGSVMGAVDGTQEERIGTGMNAEIRIYKTPTDLVQALVFSQDLEVAIMDNYLLTFYHEIIRREPVRIKLDEKQPINYGLVLAPNSTKLTKCMRQFVKNNPQEIFDIILPNLHPLKNPTDDISEELKASQAFLGEAKLVSILLYLAGALGIALFLGFVWEYGILRLIRKARKKNQGLSDEEELQTTASFKPRKSILQSLIGYRLASNEPTEDNMREQLETMRQRAINVRQLIHEYDEFYEKWLEKLKVVMDRKRWSTFPEVETPEKNSFIMVTYNGSRQ